MGQPLSSASFLSPSRALPYGHLKLVTNLALARVKSANPPEPIKLNDFFKSASELIMPRLRFYTSSCRALIDHNWAPKALNWTSSQSKLICAQNKCNTSKFFIWFKSWGHIKGTDTFLKKDTKYYISLNTFTYIIMDIGSNCYKNRRKGKWNQWFLHY